MVSFWRNASNLGCKVLIEILESGVVFDELVELFGSHIVEDAVLVESACVRRSYGPLQVIFGQEMMRL